MSVVGGKRKAGTQTSASFPSVFDEGVFAKFDCRELIDMDDDGNTKYSKPFKERGWLGALVRVDVWRTHASSATAPAPVRTPVRAYPIENGKCVDNAQRGTVSTCTGRGANGRSEEEGRTQGDPDGAKRAARTWPAFPRFAK